MLISRLVGSGQVAQLVTGANDEIQRRSINNYWWGSRLDKVNGGVHSRVLISQRTAHAQSKASQEILVSVSSVKTWQR